MKIKFSHNYKKIAGTTEARLLEVINVNLQNLSHYFITYDTDNMYILPRKGDYIMLIFQKINSSLMSIDLFTTLRRRNDKKERYYRKNIGKIFTLEITNNTQKEFKEHEDPYADEGYDGLLNDWELNKHNRDLED